MQKNFIYIIGGAVIVVLLLFMAIWFFFFRSSAPAQTFAPTSSFGTAANNSTAATNNPSSSGSNTTQPIAASGQVSVQKVFEVTAGPVVGATLIQTLNPTTTLSRYINQDDGHVYDLPLDVPGALPRVVSNTTIPGGYRAIWLSGGQAAVLQYIEGGVVKSVYMGFPASSTAATKIQFLPDNIEDIAASPDGSSIVYLLTTANGVDGYIASASSQGVGGKKLFSLPLSQVLISWPSQGTLLAQTKSAAGIPGITFSIDAKSGLITPLVYAQGLSATADPSFAHVIYQSVASNATIRLTYSHNIKSGTDNLLSFSPFPEKCIWSSQTATLMYCGSPLQGVPVNYLDLWHQGLASVADAIFSFNISTGASSIIVAPGGSDGGVPSDIFEMSLSPDEHYLSFTTKGDRALWGVRLMNN